MNIQTIERQGLKFSFVNEEEFESIYESIFIENDYRLETNNSKPFIIDCGSHIGLSVLYFKTKYPKAKVIAFEANPFTYSLLQRNIEQNNVSDVQLINAAVYDKQSEIEFFTDKDPENPWAWGDSAVINIWHSPETRESIKVKALRLSPFIRENVDLLKLDIEGLEEKVLSEIASKLVKIKEIVLEYHGSSTNPQNDSDRILSILRENGFKYKISQDGEFINECEINKDDPDGYWLMVYAKCFQGLVAE